MSAQSHWFLMYGKHEILYITYELILLVSLARTSIKEKKLPLQPCIGDVTSIWPVQFSQKAPLQMRCSHRYQTSSHENLFILILFEPCLNESHCKLLIITGGKAAQNGKEMLLYQWMWRGCGVWLQPADTHLLVCMSDWAPLLWFVHFQRIGWSRSLCVYTRNAHAAMQIKSSLGWVSSGFSLNFFFCIGFFF